MKKLCFVIKAKVTTNLFELSEKEKTKSWCGKVHFQALDTNAQFHDPEVDWKGF